MRQIRAPSNLRMLEQLLRASFAASSASSHLPHDCSAQHASRHIEPLRAAPLRSASLCPASEYARRVRAYERSPRADGTPDVATRGVAATGAERRAVSLRLPRVATSSPPRNTEIAPLRFRVRDRIDERTTSSSTTSRQGTPAIVTPRSRSLDQSHVTDSPQHPSFSLLGDRLVPGKFEGILGCSGVTWEFSEFSQDPWESLEKFAR